MDNEKFSLGIKQMSRDPWEDMPRKYPIGTKIEGSVTSVADFGAFVEIEPGIEGLVFASEIGKNIDNVHDAIKQGQRVTAIVVRIDAGEHKIALSMRAVDDREQREAIERVRQQERTQTATLGDRIPEALLEQLRRRDSGSGDR